MGWKIEENFETANEVESEISKPLMFKVILLNDDFTTKDFVVEVLSKSTMLRDTTLKLRLYYDAGVREYWIVFPDEQRVMVYNFMESIEPKQYTFDDEIPVAIWNGKCKVDFKAVNNQTELFD